MASLLKIESLCCDFNISSFVVHAVFIHLY